MNYVIDIDGTICNDSKGDYRNAKPMLDRIEIINKLFDQGHQIIYFTARGMGSSGNNVEAARTKWEVFTQEQLTRWGAKYHQLFLGKPAGDVYIDDKAIQDLLFFKIK